MLFLTSQNLWPNFFLKMTLNNFLKFGSTYLTIFSSGASRERLIQIFIFKNNTVKQIFDDLLWSSFLGNHCVFLETSKNHSRPTFVTCDVTKYYICNSYHVCDLYKIFINIPSTTLHIIRLRYPLFIRPQNVLFLPVKRFGIAPIIFN